MSKQYREHIRTDLLTSQLVSALINKMSTENKRVTKSDIYRHAIYWLAKQELDREEFQILVESSVDVDNF